MLRAATAEIRPHRVAAAAAAAGRAWLSSTAAVQGQADVVVVGSCMYDMIASTPRLPKPGETIVGTSITFGYGGKGANQCVQAGMLGATAAMVGKLGTDTVGQDTLKNFQALGVDASLVTTTPDAASGVAPIYVDSKGENCIVIVPGANMLLTLSDVEAAADLISSAKVLMTQLEIPNESTIAAMRIARNAGVTTIFNPAPAQADLPPEMLTLADFVCPNETEAEIMTGTPTNDMDGCQAAAQALLASGARNVLMTLGGAGSLLVNADGTHFTKSLPLGDAVKDTTGAGDSFLGGFAYGLASGLDVHAAIKAATAVAGYSVQHVGTQAAYGDAKAVGL